MLAYQYMPMKMHKEDKCTFFLFWVALQVLDFGGCVTDAAALSVQIDDQTVTSLYRESPRGSL